MTLTHFTIRCVHGRWTAHCRCHHHPVGAWTRTDLEQRVREIR